MQIIPDSALITNDFFISLYISNYTEFYIHLLELFIRAACKHIPTKAYVLSSKFMKSRIYIYIYILLPSN
jgi:hypothetical protein